MPLSPLSDPSPPLGSHGGAVLLFCAAVVTAVLGWFGVRSSRVAPLQMALNDAFRSLTEQLQTDRVRLSARVSMEKSARERAEAEVLRLRGLINSHIQREASLQRWAERSGLTLPL